MQHSRLKNVFLFEDKVTLRYIYRYISLSSLTKPIEFKEPSLWPDKFESRFYCAKYDQQKYPAFPRKIFALCTTANRDSEPSWKMYKQPNEPLIQIKINRKKFLEYLNQFAQSKAMILYEGKVNYDLNEHHISILHLPNYTRIVKGVPQNYEVKGHKQLFDNFDMNSFLSLLLLKRKAYDYENEVRYFLVPSEKSNIGNIITLDINWLSFVEEIRCYPQDVDIVKNEICDNIKITPIDINKGTYIDEKEIAIN